MSNRAYRYLGVFLGFLLLIGISFQNCARPPQGKRDKPNSFYAERTIGIPEVVAQPTPIPANLPIGESQTYIDGKIHGYAFDPDHIGGSVDIFMYVNPSGSSRGTFVGKCSGIYPRQTVNDSYKIHGDYGFECPVPDMYKNGTVVRLYALDPDNQSDTGYVPLQTRNTLSGALAFTGHKIPDKTSKPHGVVNKVGDGYVTGWALDESNPSAQATIHVYVNGLPGAGGTHINGGVGYLTDQNNSAAIEYGASKGMNITGKHGFRIEIPSQFRQAGTKFYVYVSDFEDPVNASVIITNKDAANIVDRYMTYQ